HQSGRLHLVESDVEAEFLAILVEAPTPAEGAAGADSHLAHRHRPPRIATDPTLEQFRLDVGPPHQLPRCPEVPRDAHLGVARQCYLDLAVDARVHGMILS